MDHCNVLYIGIQMMMINIVEASGFDFICPPYGHWNFRATWFCPNKHNYTCIYDDNNNFFEETCKGPKTYGKGFRAVLRGNIDRHKCSKSRYQPYPFSTLCGSKCIFNHSICREVGQFTVRKGTRFEDTICGCDYRKGYAFVNRPSHLYQCKPAKEDCSCYKKSCPLDKRYLSKDYHCIEETKITVLSDTTLRGTEIVRMETITKENLRINWYHHSVVNGRPISILVIIVIFFILGFGIYALLKIPFFLNELSDVQCTEGQTAEFKCCVRDKTTTLFWSINDHRIMNNPRFEILTEGCSHKLKISRTSLEDSGQITVRGKNGQCQAQLTVRNLFVGKMNDILCTVGQTAVLKCQVREDVELTWYHNNNRVMRSERFCFMSEDKIYKLKITDVTFEDRGQYSIAANNVECKALLIVEGKLPEIYLKPFCFGENIILPPTYDAYALEWYKDKAKHGPGDNESKILEIKSASFENEGIYFAKFDHRVITVEMHIEDKVLLTKEDFNYLLIVNVILRRALPAVRHIFDQEFHPSKLYDIIIQNGVKLNALKKKRRINHRQWDLLSKTRETVSSKNFDLRLLICILRNIGPRMNVIDDLPETSNRSVEANLSRIKYSRNTIAHNLEHGRLLDKPFYTIWEDLRKSITDLCTIPINEKVNAVGQESLSCTDEFFTTLTQVLKNECNSVKEHIRMLSLEEIHYLRIVHILHRVACPAVRIKFNLLFTSEQINDILRENKNDIKSYFTPNEMSVLYPQKGSPVLHSFGLKVLIIFTYRYGKKFISVAEDNALHKLEELSHKVAESSCGILNSNKFKEYWKTISMSIISLSGKYGKRFRNICFLLCPKDSQQLFDLIPDDDDNYTNTLPRSKNRT